MNYLKPTILQQQVHLLNTQLYELKLVFEKAIVYGNSLDDVKRIYKKIQELKSRIIEVRVEILKAETDEDVNIFI